LQAVAVLDGHGGSDVVEAVANYLEGWMVEVSWQDAVFDAAFDGTGGRDVADADVSVGVDDRASAATHAIAKADAHLHQRMGGQAIYDNQGCTVTVVVVPVRCSVAIEGACSGLYFPLQCLLV
jgi:hypothetical protein